MQEDARLAGAAAAGDVAAFGVLVRAYQGRVRAFLLRVTGGRHALADDLAQETFITALRKMRQYRSEGSFEGWLCRIAYSRFLMNARARKQESPIEDIEIGHDDRPALHARLDLESAMVRLSPPERAALTLCYALGHSNEEAASILSMPLGTLKSHTVRGRKKLQSMLKEWEGAI